MASGAILGECPVCGDCVWEDEWTLDAHDVMVHTWCKGRRMKYGTAAQKQVEDAISLLRDEGFYVLRGE